MPTETLNERSKVVVEGVGLTFKTPGGDVQALEDVSLSVAPGEFVCLLGPSGCGKSSLLRIVAGLITPTRGSVRIERDQGTDRPLSAMVFQDYALLPWRNVLDNVLFGPENRGVPRDERRRIGEEILAKVGLSAFARAYPHQLSGGMKQRVSIARALANDPEVLLMDEPLAALDAQTRLLMQEELMRIWAAFGKTVLYVTHSIEEAILLGDRVILLTARPGRIKAAFAVELPRPRAIEARSAPEFVQLETEIWHQLRDEVLASDGR